MTSDGFQRFLDQTRDLPNLTATEERELSRRMHLGDESAREKLTMHNVRLCVSMARRWTGNGHPLEDLVQDALVGLSIAIERFDPDKGRLTTIATRWIRKQLWDSVYGGSNTIKRPSRLSRTASAVRDALANEPGLTVEELADLVERPVDEVRESLDHARVVASTDVETFVEVGEAELEEVGDGLAALDVDEREAVSWRYGLYGQPASLEAAARKMSADATLPGHFEPRDVARLCRSATRKLRAARMRDDDVICELEVDEC